MIRTTIWFIYFWLYLIYLIPRLIKVIYLDKAGRVQERDKIAHTTAAKWSQDLLRLAGVRYQVSGVENVPSGQPVVFVSNHQGNFDIPLLLAAIEKPKAFVAKTELARIPLLSTWMKYIKCVFMDRSDIRQSLKAISEASGYVKEGYSMVIFPEGTRSNSREMGEFKPGSMKLALKSKAVIVPVSINGSYKIMQERNFLIKPGSVEITISEPISTTELSKDQEANLSHTVREVIKSNL